MRGSRSFNHLNNKCTFEIKTVGRILFDITPASWVANGSGIYTRFVFEQILKQDKEIDAFYLDEGKFDNDLILVADKHNCKIISCKTLTEIENLINSGHYSKVYFGALKNTDVKISENITPIITLHDLRFIEVDNDKTRYLYANSIVKRIKLLISYLFNLQLDKKAYLKWINSFINHPKLQIITVSNHTRFSIIQYFPNFPKENIHVFYCPLPLPISDNRTIKSDLNPKYGLETKSYFLIVSANRWFKNSYRAIQALDGLISKNQLGNKKVLVLGAKDAKKITDVKNTNRFIFENYVSFEDLQLFYKNAFCFIYPSLQEGFGIPPLEAMRYGTPVLASINSSIAEVCEGGVLFFNPYLISEIQNRILQILEDPSVYMELGKRAEQRSQEILKKQNRDLQKQLKFILS